MDKIGTALLLTLTSSVFASPAPTKTSNWAPRQAPGASTKYWINFGDSYSQLGFNASGNLATAGNILGNPPFPGWTTVNGNRYNWLDTDIAVHNTSLTLAANLAVGGATTDADLVTAYAPFPTVYSFKDQVHDFETYLSPPPAAYPWTSEDTMFSVWMGVNDVGMGWYSSNPSWPELLAQIMDVYFGLVDRLYQAGARNFLFLTVPPTDLTPYTISLGPDVADALSTAIADYNNELQSRVESFSSTNGDVQTWVFDTTSSFTEPVENPTAYGAIDATCYSSTGTQCLWFNDFHPGQAIHDLVAQGVADLIGNW